MAVGRVLSPSRPSDQTMFLPPHLSFCEVGGRFVFLDRRQGRYFLLEVRLSEALNGILTRGSDDMVSDDARHALISSGVALNYPGRPLRPVEYDPPTTSALLEELPPARAIDLVATLTSEMAARRALGRDGFDTVIGKLEGLPSPSGPAKAERRAALLAASEATRRYRTVHDQCLPRSIVLTRALRRRGDSAKLVLGVTGSPFTAHAWVQDARCVLNDELDRVRLFTPILVV